MSTDATDIRCAECGRDITHATSIYLVSGRYVCDICYVRLTASRDCTHGHLARSCEICQLEADNAALRVLVEEHEELKAKLQARVAELEAWSHITADAWTTLADDAEWECDCKVCASIREWSRHKRMSGARAVKAQRIGGES